MDHEVLKTVGQVGGIGGLALGVFLLLFRDIIRKNIFPKLPPADAYRLLRLITGAVWSIAVLGIAAWVYVSTTGTHNPNGNGNNVVSIDGVAAGDSINARDIKIENNKQP